MPQKCAFMVQFIGVDVISGFIGALSDQVCLPGGELVPSARELWCVSTARLRFLHQLLFRFL